MRVFVYAHKCVRSCVRAYSVCVCVHQVRLEKQMLDYS
jgi:hypothetical protein